MCSKKQAECCAGEIFIRALNPSDWETFRAIRLCAVRMHTGYFLADPEEVEARPPSEWQETLDGQGKQVFGLFDGDRLIGITGVFTSREDPSGRSGMMAMSFIEPEYRGKGYADLLYSARIDFALRHEPWTKLCIGHRRGNEPSRRSMVRHGFTFIGTKEIDWPDGTRDIEYLYEMDLEAARQDRA